MVYPIGHILHPPVKVRDTPGSRRRSGITIGALSALIGHELYLTQRLPNLGPNTDLQSTTCREADHLFDLGSGQNIIVG